jgi:hypothetical protein
MTNYPTNVSGSDKDAFPLRCFICPLSYELIDGCSISMQELTTGTKISINFISNRKR